MPRLLVVVGVVPRVHEVAGWLLPIPLQCNVGELSVKEVVPLQ